MTEPEKKPADGRPPGEILAVSMLEQLARSNDLVEKGQKLMSEAVGHLDSLNGWFEVLDRTMEILDDQTGTSKQKISLSDFAHAWVSAADEIMGEDEEDNTDPLVGAER